MDFEGNLRPIGSFPKMLWLSRQNQRKLTDFCIDMQSKNEFDPSKLDRVISKDALTIATKSAGINGFLYRYAKQKRIWPIQTRSCHFQRCFDYRDQIISKDSWTQSSRSWSDVNYYQCAQPWNIHETGLKLGWSNRGEDFKIPLPSGQNCPGEESTLLAKILTKGHLQLQLLGRPTLCNSLERNGSRENITSPRSWSYGELSL